MGLIMSLERIREMKLDCLRIADGDVDKAREMWDFIKEDLA